MTHTPRRWTAPDGSFVSCSEKLKVLEQNLLEFEQMVTDILEDAALMGCDVEQVRGVLTEKLGDVVIRYGTK
ncbi:MAG: hypothetical protein ACM33T_08965 [Solirubrobacterales bacterium]